MSVEAFFGAYQPTVDFKANVQRIREGNRWWGRSDIEVFARAMVSAASDGLRTLDGRTWERSSVAVVDPVAPNQMVDGNLNYCMLLFGLSLIGLERALVERSFDRAWLCEEHNEAIRGVRIMNIKVHSGVEPVEHSSHEQWMRMVQLAKKDKTLAIFFEQEGFSALPQGIAELFTFPTIMFVRRLILPEYKKRAEALLYKPNYEVLHAEIASFLRGEAFRQPAA